MQHKASEIDSHVSLSHLKDTLAEAQRNRDTEAEAVAWSKLGDSYAHLGEPESALACYARYYDTARAIHNRIYELLALNSLGNVHTNLRQFETALRYYTQYLEVARELGSRQHEGVALNNLGATYTDLHNTPLSRQCYLQYLAISRELGDQQGEAIASRNLGLLCERDGDLEQAVQLLQVYIDYDQECDATDRQRCIEKVAEITKRLQRAASKSWFWRW